LDGQGAGHQRFKGEDPAHGRRVSAWRPSQLNRQTWH
jgi:hypothetical protein